MHGEHDAWPKEMCTRSDNKVLHVGFASGCNQCAPNSTQLIHVGTFRKQFL